MLKFMGLMNSSWVLDGHDIATAFDLSCFQDIVDLGGKRGNIFRGKAGFVNIYSYLLPKVQIIPHPCCFFTKLPGCTGALAREVAKAYPSSSVTVFDLPQVVEMAQQRFCQDDDAVTFRAGEPHSAPLSHSGTIKPTDAKLHRGCKVLKRFSSLRIARFMNILLSQDEIHLI